MFIYDQNGLLDYFCQKLTEKQVEYIDLATWGYVNPGFKGSAIISATFWEHDVFDGTGFFMRNLVGLGAVAIERKGRRGYEEDIPGDEAAGSRGIPFASTFDEDGEPVFEFCFMGYAPLCPGFPDLRPDPADCPAEITVSCENCPLPIPATGTAGMMDTAIANVGITAQCEVVDVNVTLDLNHTWNADLDVDLTSPEGTPSRLFDDICGASDNMQVILDDDAGAPDRQRLPAVGLRQLHDRDRHRAGPLRRRAGGWRVAARHHRRCGWRQRHAQRLRGDAGAAGAVGYRAATRW